MTKLHLVTQRGQSYGSTRRCCELCGKAIFAMVDGERYAQYEDTFINLCAEGVEYTSCVSRDAPTAPKSLDASTPYRKRGQ